MKPYFSLIYPDEYIYRVSMKRRAREMKKDLSLLDRLKYPIYKSFFGTNFERLDGYFDAYLFDHLQFDAKSMALRKYEREPSPYFDALDMTDELKSTFTGLNMGFQPRDRRVIFYEGLEDEHYQKHLEKEGEEKNQKEAIGSA